MSKSLYSFPKDERLHHRSLVEGLYRLGHSFYEFPFRITWRILSDEDLLKNFRNNPPDGIGKVQVMVAVPKKKRKRAVDRVLLRRRIKEAYRLQKQGLTEMAETSPFIRTLSIGIVYLHDRNLNYSIIEEKMAAVLEKLKKKLENKTSA